SSTTTTKVRRRFQSRLWAKRSRRLIGMRLARTAGRGKARALAVHGRAAPHPAAATFSPQAGRREMVRRFPQAVLAEGKESRATRFLLPACGEKVAGRPDEG